MENKTIVENTMIVAADFWNEITNTFQYFNNVIDNEGLKGEIFKP